MPRAQYLLPCGVGTTTKRATTKDLGRATRFFFLPSCYHVLSTTRTQCNPATSGAGTKPSPSSEGLSNLIPGAQRLSKGRSSPVDRPPPPRSSLTAGSEPSFEPRLAGFPTSIWALWPTKRPLPEDLLRPSRLPGSLLSRAVSRTRSPFRSRALPQQGKGQG